MRMIDLNCFPRGSGTERGTLTQSHISGGRGADSALDESAGIVNISIAGQS